MDKNKLTVQLEEKIKELEFQNQILREKQEHRSREEKARLRNIVENVPGVVFQFYARNDGEAGVYYTSPKLYEMFGLKFVKNSPRFFEQFVGNIHEEDRQSWVDSVQEAVVEQRPWKWKGRYVKPSGRVIWFEGQSIPTVREDEIVFDGIFIDITEKIEQETEALEVTRQQEQFKKLESLKTMAGSIAHRFNNAMMAVEGNLELMLLTLPDESGEHRMAENAVQAARGASQIGSMMLSYVGRKPLQLQKASLADLVRESIVACKNGLDPSITLKFTPPDQPLYCSVDPQQIDEVIQSILTNAVESFKNDSGVVDITFGAEYVTTDSFPMFFQDGHSQDGIYTYCQIKDSGHGISPGNITKIFEPFYTTRFVGRGLGLALTAGIMLKHHGAITVESVPESGTTIRVLLPSISQSSKKKKHITAPVQTEDVQLSGDILLADDEPILLVFVKMMLEQLGFTVHTAVDGQEAVAEVRKQNIEFCAVVIDILMPEMNGIEAMKEIRKINPDIPVLLISGYSEEDVPLQGNKPDAFMVKPVQLSDMRSKLTALLS